MTAPQPGSPLVPKFKIQPLVWIDDGDDSGGPFIGAVFRAPSKRLIYIGSHLRSQWEKPYYLKTEYLSLRDYKNGNAVCLPWCLFHPDLTNLDDSPISAADRAWFENKVLGAPKRQPAPKQTCKVA